MTSNTTLSPRADDSPTRVYRTRHDFDGDDRVSTSVVLAVSNALAADPTDLDTRLYDALDPDALDRLFADDARGGSPCRLTFALAGCSVTVRSDGWIHVRREE